MAQNRDQDRVFPSSISKPSTASIQVTYSADVQPFGGYSQLIAPTFDDPVAAYRRGTELRRERRLAEALGAFDRAIALKPDYAEAYNSRGIVLASSDRPEEAVVAFDRAIALKPDYAEAYNNRGIVLQDLKRLAEALASFDTAMARQINNASVHNNRGTVLRELKRQEEAISSFSEAIALKPDYAEAYYNRATALHEIGRFDEAIADFDAAIAMRPDYADAYNNRGVILQDVKRLNEALADFDRASALLPDFAEVHCNKAYCSLLMGKFEQGWRLHEWRKKTQMPVGNRSLPGPLWLGREEVAGKTVFLHWEQGLGDTLQFCRYGKLLNARGAKVVMSVQEPLYGLLGQLGPGVQVIHQDEAPAAFDFHCPMMSLPLAFATTLQNIPSEDRYLVADDRLRRQWSARLPPPTRPRIGLVWAGSKSHKNDRNRSMGLSALARLFDTGAHWISLQKEVRDGDAAALQQYPHVFRCGDDLKDFSDTAAAIDLLDLVITVDTSVAHLAGAMGKPVWIMLPFNSDWRWLVDRDDSPWYPAVRLFRQHDPRSWDNVISSLRAALESFLRSRS